MIVEMLSKVAEGLLLLTATPEQLGIESHFGRLRLLDPERYADLGQFISESQDQKAIADLVEKIADSKVLNKKEQAKLVDLVGKKGLDDLEQNRDAIIEDLLDRYGPGRVIFRNTRAAMQGFPKRIARLTPLSPKEKKDAKLDWLVEKMDKLAPAKVLLICKTKEQVLQLDEALRSCTALNPAVFHEDLSIVQRDRNAAWFAEAEGTRLLLCSEIGSEGRNFQFAHHLILYDVPAQPELLEQRIGRLDRIGQTADIQIHVPYLKGSEEEVLVRWYHEGLNAFEQNLVGGNAISKQFGEQLDALSTSIDQKQLSKLLKETASFQQALRTQLAAGRNRLLEMNSFRPKVSSALIEQIKDEDRSADLERYMTEVFEYFGVDMEDLAPRSYRLRPSRENRDAFPSIPPEGASITFDRKRALSREDMRFVSWDHPMATGAIDMVLSTGAGSASYGLLRQGQGSALLLEAVFVLETSGGKGLAVDRFLPATPLRVVVDHSGKALTEEYPVDEVDPHLIAGNIDDLLENEVLVETLLPHMLKAAAEEAETRAQLVMAQSLRAMSQSLDHEIDRLIALQQKNDAIRSEELDAARRAKEELSELIVGRRVRLDAVQVMRVG
jgi:ATP-dependent helicase HepA